MSWGTFGRGIGAATFTTVLVVACSDGGGGEGAGSSSEFITSLCDLLGSCCSKEAKTYNQSKCVTFYNGLLTDTTYDAAAGQTCLEKLRAAQSSATFCGNGADDTSNSCGGVFKKAGSGTKQPGDLCEADDDCATQSDGEVECSSFSTGGATTRKCQVFTRAKEGDVCVGTKETDDGSGSVSSNDQAPRVGVCWGEDDLYCDTNGSKKCVKRIPEGGSCEAFSSKCAGEARCDSAQRKCVPRLADGAPCETTSSIDDACLPKSHCDRSTKKCAPALAIGAACTSSSECGDAFCSDGKCGSNNASTTLACD